MTTQYRITEFFDTYSISVYSEEHDAYLLNAKIQADSEEQAISIFEERE